VTLPTPTVPVVPLPPFVFTIVAPGTGPLLLPSSILLIALLFLLVSVPVSPRVSLSRLALLSLLSLVFTLRLLGRLCQLILLSNETILWFFAVALPYLDSSILNEMWCLRMHHAHFEFFHRLSRILQILLQVSILFAVLFFWIL
jgi:hypothetical protein